MFRCDVCQHDTVYTDQDWHTNIRTHYQYEPILFKSIGPILFLCLNLAELGMLFIRQEQVWKDSKQKIHTVSLWSEYFHITWQEDPSQCANWQPRRDLCCVQMLESWVGLGAAVTHRHTLESSQPDESTWSSPPTGPSCWGKEWPRSFGTRGMWLLS